MFYIGDQQNHHFFSRRTEGIYFSNAYKALGLCAVNLEFSFVVTRDNDVVDLDTH